MRRILSLLVAFAMVFSMTTGLTVTTASAADEGTVVRLDPSNASPFNGGEFQGWGTSLCWWANRVGYSESLVADAAEKFFSEDGLGLDIARYNLGGGDDPTHDHITRSDSKIPCYATAIDAAGNYTYDWTADANQRAVAKAAQAVNPDLYFEGFSNSPPWFITISGCSSGASDASQDNLSSEHFNDFGKFIAEVTKHFKDEFGITFQSYSPMNEPDTSYWGAMSPKQEGSHYSPGATQSGTIIATRNALDKVGLNNVLVAGMDETDIDKTVKNYASLTAEAKQALGRIDTHTYSGSNRAGAKSTAVSAGKDLWMSEVDGGWDGFGLAGRIITDMNGMQPAAWVIWDIIDSHKDSTSDMRVSGEANTSLSETGAMWGIGMANHDTGKLEFANKYYFFGQFTKYINPGDTIIASSNSTLAAYNKTTGDIKIVALNSGSSDKKTTFDLGAFTSVGGAVKEIRTNNATGSSAEHWKEITGEATLTAKKLTTTLKAGTVTTYVISGGEPSLVKTPVSLTDTALTYSQYNLKDYDQYVAVYDSNKALKYLSANKSTENKEGDFAGCTYKTFTWDGVRPVGVNVAYATISGSGSEIDLGSSVTLSVDTNIIGDISWSVSDENIAAVDNNGKVTTKASGSFDVIATVDGFETRKTFTVPAYKLTGTPSWSNASTAPDDNADYRKAADGDLSTYFDGPTNGWVQYDFGTPFKASEIKLAARSGLASRTVGGKVQGSNDAISWTDLYTISTALDAGSYTTLTGSDLANNKAYRFYRYTNTANMANIAEFLIDGAASNDTPENAPVVTDISEFTDNFESDANIFQASEGTLSDTGNIVFDSGLERFGKAFAPAKATAVSSLATAKTLTSKDMFRLTFNMFAGWENSGKENTFAIKNAEGEEILVLYMTGGGYNLNQLRVGGKDVLGGSQVVQCRTAMSGRTGANGWGDDSQPYRNTMGFNKTVEITIDGAGNVSASLTGGLNDITATGKLTAPVTIGSIEATGDYNSSAARTVSYDNFDGDIITYTTDFEAEPDPEPLVVPESGELISMNFDEGTLASTSDYGKATGAPKFVTEDGKKCIQFDGTSATAVTLTDANGDPLLLGQDNITVSFKVKPTGTGTSWWLFAANDSTSRSESNLKYLGVLEQNTKLTIERYNASRATGASGSVLTLNTWHDVLITVEEGSTSLYVDGSLIDTKTSDFKLSDILGKNSVAYIGRANWGSGEYATGYLDDFVIYNSVVVNPLSSVSIGDTSAVTANLSLPAAVDGNAISWETSDANIVTAAGVITRDYSDKTATLTASVTADGLTYTRNYDITVAGKATYLDDFTAYSENGSIKYTSTYTTGGDYDFHVKLEKDEALVGTEKLNTATGSFESLANGTYKITGYITETGQSASLKAVTKTIIVKDEVNTAAYLFAHFVGTQEDATKEQIYFSVSTDGTTWKTLNSGSPVLTSDVGERGVRDPYIMRAEDGSFVMIATDLSIYNINNNWGQSQTAGSKNIVVWKSDDLVNWSNASLAKIGIDETGNSAGCVWAPEAVYDAEEGRYMVFWASKVSSDNYAKQRVYRSYTSDFVNFTAPEVYIENENDAIDTTIISEKGVYYRFTKDETAKAVTMMKSTSLSSGWKNVDTYTINGAAGNSVTGYEGPTIYKLNGENKWCLLLDYYSKSQGYKPFVTEDISVGAFTSAADFTFDATYRHGTVMPITQAEYDALIENYPIGE